MTTFIFKHHIVSTNIKTVKQPLYKTRITREIQKVQVRMQTLSRCVPLIKYVFTMFRRQVLTLDIKQVVHQQVTLIMCEIKEEFDVLVYKTYSKINSLTIPTVCN